MPCEKPHVPPARDLPCGQSRRPRETPTGPPNGGPFAMPVVRGRTGRPARRRGANPPGGRFARPRETPTTGTGFCGCNTLFNPLCHFGHLWGAAGPRTAAQGRRRSPRCPAPCAWHRPTARASTHRRATATRFLHCMKYWIPTGTGSNLMQKKEPRFLTKAGRLQKILQVRTPQAEFLIKLYQSPAKMSSTAGRCVKGMRVRVPRYNKNKRSNPQARSKPQNAARREDRKLL